MASLASVRDFTKSVRYLFYVHSWKIGRRGSNCRIPAPAKKWGKVVFARPKVWEPYHRIRDLGLPNRRREGKRNHEGPFLPERGMNDRALVAAMDPSNPFAVTRQKNSYSLLSSFPLYRHAQMEVAQQPPSNNPFASPPSPPSPVLHTAGQSRDRHAGSLFSVLLL